MNEKSKREPRAADGGGAPSPEAAVEAADRAAEAMRGLSHAVSFRAGEGVPWPSTLYMVLGSLAPGAASLSTALWGMEQRIKELHRLGRVDIVEGEYAGDPDRAVSGAVADLERAQGAAKVLADSLRSAQGRMTWMGTPYSEDELGEAG